MKCRFAGRHSGRQAGMHHVANITCLIVSQRTVILQSVVLHHTNHGFVGTLPQRLRIAVSLFAMICSQTGHLQRCRVRRQTFRQAARQGGSQAGRNTESRGTRGKATGPEEAGRRRSGSASTRNCKDKIRELRRTRSLLSSARALPTRRS